jgi:oligopeptidase B
MASAPMAPQRPQTLTSHGRSRDDPWYWLRDREDPEVVAYLEAENAYTE